MRHVYKMFTERFKIMSKWLKSKGLGEKINNIGLYCLACCRKTGLAAAKDKTGIYIYLYINKSTLNKVQVHP